MLPRAANEAARTSGVEPLQVRVCESVVRQARADALPPQPKSPQLGPGVSFIDEILRTDRHAPGEPMWPLSRSKL